ncbi:iron-containing alcohol dehydrogenase family protein [Halocalculus aciditolerans]|uniref:Alcohol dehydrogenase n=1 Tax=Halocalculus aciditolerans TaxID=1383812 RepID=A0A830F099_9EURY|nr:iron-containing alcohol dehydrogenase family protein [Halocalculus aciditolerans]GGL48333.1 alcohol dehydrogenase [Halocalculus aciditolerans]
MPHSFRFEYESPTIRFGAGSVSGLADELAAAGASNALVVTGTSVGANDDVMDPVRAGLGDALAGVFAETTPEKLLSTALDGVDVFERADADSVVAVGGGSSLDVARAVCALAVTDDRDAAVDTYAETHALPVPDAALPPMAVVPTTLAGADLSFGGGLNATDPDITRTPISGGLSDPALTPTAAFYDPELVATTPRRVLASSAMNGFDKGVEAIYTTAHTPVTDATAVRGVRRLTETLPGLGPDAGETDYAGILEGILLVQYGIKRPDGSGLGLVHAFGHGLTAHSAVQQGSAHAITAPHALAYLLEQTDARRDVLADALGVDSDGIVDAVAAVRDSLGLPTRLRDVDDVSESSLDAIAESTHADGLLDNLPAGVDPTVADLRGVLEDAW